MGEYGRTTGGSERVFWAVGGLYVVANTGSVDNKSIDVAAMFAVAPWRGMLDI